MVVRNFVSYNMLWTNQRDLIKFYICIDHNQIYVWIVTRQFSHIYNKIMVLEYRQYLVSVHYLRNELME